MSNERNTTIPRDLATGAIDWPELIDGKPALYAQAVELSYLLGMLAGEIEMGLDAQRGVTDEHGTVTLMFQAHSLNAKIWLAGDVWGRARALVEMIEAAQQAMDADGGLVNDAELVGLAGDTRQDEAEMPLRRVG